MCCVSWCRAFCRCGHVVKGCKQQRIYCRPASPRKKRTTSPSSWTRCRVSWPTGNTQTYTGRGVSNYRARGGDSAYVMFNTRQAVYICGPGMCCPGLCCPGLCGWSMWSWSMLSSSTWSLSVLSRSVLSWST